MSSAYQKRGGFSAQSNEHDVVRVASVGVGTELGLCCIHATRTHFYDGDDHRNERGYSGSLKVCVCAKPGTSGVVKSGMLDVINKLGPHRVTQSGQVIVLAGIPSTSRVP